MSTDRFTSEQVSPADIKIRLAEQAMTVQWRNGRTSTFDMVTLRKNCPCATCNSERQNQKERKELFPILKHDPGTSSPRALGAELVGNYAIQLRWSDGHNTGIYDFRFLRSLVEASQERTGGG